METSSKVLVSKERTVYTYSELWHASGCVLESGLNQAQGSVWQFLSSAVLTAFAFEAYLNHIGPRCIECWEQLDRLPPWSKFELLCETLGVSFPDGTGARPLQTITTLLEFRNTMAHGRSAELKPKPEVRTANDNLDSYLGERPLMQWERLIRDEIFAKRAREDVERVLNNLHDARKDEKEALFTFGTGFHSASGIPES